MEIFTDQGYQRILVIIGKHGKVSRATGENYKAETTIMVEVITVILTTTTTGPGMDREAEVLTIVTIIKGAWRVNQVILDNGQWMDKGNFLQTMTKKGD